MSTDNNPRRPKHSAFITTHCTTCAAGWTRVRPDGEAVIVCLLDREPVITDMADCDRYEPREAKS